MSSVGGGKRRNSSPSKFSKKKSSMKCGEEGSSEMDTSRNLSGDMVINPSDGADWSRLPLEILTETFTFLSGRDRKNVRSVCSSWFEACNVVKFLNNETLFCNASINADMDAVIETLKSSTRNVLNLEFSDVNFDETSWSLGFWMQCGPKIRSLSLRNCVLSDESLMHVIQYCDRLESLVLNNTRSGKGSPQIRIGTCFRELIESNVRRNSLTYIQFMEWTLPSNNFLRAIFIIYPNIKHLFFACHVFDYFFKSAEKMLENPTSKCTFSCILKKLIDSQETLESFGFGTGWITDEEAGVFWKAISTLKFTKLKEFKVGFETEGIRQDIRCLFNFLSRHKLLESVTLLLPIHASPRFIEKLMLILLDNCPRLKSLNLFRSYEPEAPVVVGSIVLAKLIQSKLESLTISFGLETLEEDELMEDIYNDKLKELCLTDVPNGAFEENDSSLICRLFRGLTVLEIEESSFIDDDAFQCILQYMPHLTNLKLNFDDLSDYAFMGALDEEESGDGDEGYSISRLNKLEYLKLVAMQNEQWDLNAESLIEFKFPNLKYLYVELGCSWNLTSEFLKIIPNFPKLEKLILFFCEEVIDRTQLLELCGQLKRLTNLQIRFERCENFDDDTYKSVFECCSSLRFFRYQSGEMECQSYFYDVVSRKVVCSKNPE